MAEPADPVRATAGIMGKAAGEAMAVALETKRLRAEIDRLTLALGDEHARLSAEAEANVRNNEALAEAYADLRACRARLAALVAANSAHFDTGHGGLHGWPLAWVLANARDWLAAHPAKGGQDASV